MSDPKATSMRMHKEITAAVSKKRGELRQGLIGIWWEDGENGNEKNKVLLVRNERKSLLSMMIKG